MVKFRDRLLDIVENTNLTVNEMMAEFDGVIADIALAAVDSAVDAKKSSWTPIHYAPFTRLEQLEERVASLERSRGYPYYPEKR